MNQTFIQKLGFSPKENSQNIFNKTYKNNYIIEIDFDKESIHYGNKIQSESKTTSNFSQKENWVVLECVNRLLEKGYKPEDIILEKVFPSGHGTSGRLDLLVKKEGKSFLMIECKTWGKEYEKELKNMQKNGGQLFTYFQQDKDAEYLVLYASNENGEYKNDVVVMEESYKETSNVADLFTRWSKQTKENGIFENWVPTYKFESKALIYEILEDIQEEDASKIFNRFLEILRHNTVSDKPNAFNKMFTLFLCKIYDELDKNGTSEELDFQWVEGKDTPISFQKRLTDLYKKGMEEFLKKQVTDFSDDDFENQFGDLISDNKEKQKLLEHITKLRLQKNNEFAIKEVFDDESFDENAKVLKEIVELLQNYKFRYTKKQPFLGDFFELLLTTGLKQEAGQFFTPVPIARFICKSIPIEKIIDQKLDSGENHDILPNIIDYAAGSGHFLIESMEEVQSIINNKNVEKYNNNIKKQFGIWKLDPYIWAKDYNYGIEKDYRLVRTSKVGCYLHGDGIATVIHGDGLDSFEKSSDYRGKLKKHEKEDTQQNAQFDLVLSNPPYSVSAFKGNLKREQAEKDFDLFKYVTDQSSEIEALFIERTSQLLKQGGIAGIILPSSILSNAGIYTKAREIILKDFEIIAITELGSNTFMATGTNTVTLFLRKRNKYFARNLKTNTDKFFTDFRDVTFNGIENAVSKYVAEVWENIDFEEYKEFLQGNISENIEKNDIFKEYKSKIKAKTEKEFLEKVIEREKEKLFYFVLSYPQKVVLVKSGEKKKEKEFLGYEFSNRKGSEGIHPMQRGRQIDECTKLFDPHSFDNPEKASTYIYDAFLGNFEREIDEEMQNHIKRVSLVDLLTFDRVDFEKNISLNKQEKVRIESKYKLEKLNEILEVLESGNRPKGGVGSYNEGIPSLGGEHIGLDGKVYIDKNNIKFVPESFFEKANRGILKDNDILICKDGALTGKIALFQKAETDYEKLMINEHVFLLRTNSQSLQKYLFDFLFSKLGQKLLKSNITGQAQGGLNRTNLLNIQIPLPPIEIQEKIVAEVGKLDEKFATIRMEIEEYNTEIKDIFEKFDISAGGG